VNDGLSSKSARLWGLNKHYPWVSQMPMLLLVILTRTNDFSRISKIPTRFFTFFDIQSRRATVNNLYPSSPPIFAW